MEEIKDFFYHIILIALISIVGVVTGYQSAKRHYEPLLKSCEQNQINWEVQYQRLKEIERKFDKAEMIIELEEAKRRASVIWNDQVIYPDEGN